jgi:hypothetical protein
MAAGYHTRRGGKGLETLFLNPAASQLTDPILTPAAHSGLHEP